MPEPFKTALLNNSFNYRFQLVGPDGRVVAEIWTREPYEANSINDAFATFAELNRIPFEKAKNLYLDPFPPDGP